jgi:DivIVA domain-containing protein
MTAGDIRHATLGRTGLGRRGYHEPDVDELLDRIADDVDAWAGDLAVLRAENEALKTALRDWQSSQHGNHVYGAAGNEDPVALLRRVHECVEELPTSGHRERRLLRAQQQAHDEAGLAVHDYRFRAGTRYSAAIEELEQRIAWARVFFGVMREAEPLWDATADALAHDGELDGDLGWGPDRFM